MESQKHKTYSEDSLDEKKIQKIYFNFFERFEIQRIFLLWGENVGMNLV